MNVDAFLEQFTSWARAQSDIEGVALVGSHARGAANKDSDVDLIILVSNARPYFENREWLSLFGELERSQNETWGQVETLRAFYRKEFEVEYNFCPPSWAEVPVDAGTSRVVNDGIKILFDRRSKFETLLRALSAERAVTH
jgi:predicted nucleotidyltransferase